MPLIIYALQRWGELNDETGEELGFRRSGLVYATQEESDIAAWDKWIQMAKGYGVRSSILTAEQAKAMTPWQHHKLAGRSLSADPRSRRTTAGRARLVAGALKKGRCCFQQCAVRGLDIAAGRVSGVWTERGLIKTSRVIRAAGAWTSMFCRRHGIDSAAGQRDLAPPSARSPLSRRLPCHSTHLALPVGHKWTAVTPSQSLVAGVWNLARRGCAMPASSIRPLKVAARISPWNLGLSPIL